MKRWRHNILLNEKGFVFTVAFLLFLPLLFYFFITSNNHAQVTLQADLNAGQALDDAVRAAAMCVDARSQAYGDARMVPERAHEIFKTVLAINLDLDPDTLIPLKSSGLIEKPEYILVVYNGNNPYGLPAGKKYYSYIAGGFDMVSGDLPQTFVIGSDITIGTGGEIETTLDSPGCIAILVGKTNLMGKGETEFTRWRASRIVISRDFY